MAICFRKGGWEGAVGGGGDGTLSRSDSVTVLPNLSISRWHSTHRVSAFRSFQPKLPLQQGSAGAKHRSM